jgi:hypothetical protein
LSERSRSGRVVVKMDQPPLQKEVSETEALLESGSISSRGADASPSSTSSSASSKYLRTAAKVSVGCLAVAGVVMLGATRSNAANKENLAALAASSGESDITLTSFSENRDLRKTIASYPNLGITTLAEPFKPTSFIVTFTDDTLREKVASGAKVCKYTVQSVLNGEDVPTPWDYGSNVASAFTETGALTPMIPPGADEDAQAMGLEATLPSPGDYTATIECSDGGEAAEGVEATSKSVEAFSKDISCYYIRRELRELTTRERDDFLDAVKILTEVPTNDGIAKYGPNYKSLEDFEIMHLAGAGERNLDHIHDGMGISTQHTAMTSEFEQALQAVNPKVAVPYWDYTVDSVKMSSDKKYRPESFSDIFRDSELFTGVWFGTTNAKDHRIADGRFADQEVPRDYNYKVRSPYGFLRAPWNLNPSKYVTRYHKYCGANPAAQDVDFTDDKEEFPWPTCADHFLYTNTDYVTSWYDFEMDIGYKPHGPVHGWIGGVGGECESTWDEMHREGLISPLQLQKMKHTAFIMLKNLWRSRLLETPKFCSPDTPVKECMWHGVENFADHPKVQKYVLEIWGIGKETENYEEILRRAILQTPYWPGDHLEAASPAEVSFWPIHPTIDRLVQYRDQARPFTDTSWANISSTCVETATDCKGHNAYDVTYYQSTVWDSDLKTYTKAHLTNIEMRNALNPTKEYYRMSYLYNHFEWTHCEEFGVSFKLIAGSH